MPAGGSRRSRTAVLSTLLAFGALLLFAHAPLLRAGLFSWDYAEALAGRWPARAWLAVHGGRLPAPGGSAPVWRLESLLVLVGLALSARAFLARLLEPRIGSHAARAAALVAALLIPLHPAAPGATAELAARAEGLALLVGLAAGALFLRGRQEERDAFTATGLLLIVVAGFFSGVAILLALLFAVAEFGAVRRHRRRSLRLRTAATTALLFGAGAALPLLVRSTRATDPAVQAALSAGDELRARALRCGAELGHVASADVPAAGALATLFAGGLLLLALQPAFRAARNAPRLWGGILLTWSAALFGALAWASTGGSGGRLLGLVVWSAGLGLAITALARPWRAGLAATVALGWSVLAHAGARPWLIGSQGLTRLHAEIIALGPPRDARVLVLDPPAIEGLPPLGRNLSWLFHPALDSGADESEFDPRRVRGLTSAAFLALTRSEAFASLRAEPLVVLAPGVRLGQGRTATRVSAARPANPQPNSWRGALKFAPELPLDPLQIEQVRIVAELASQPREIERLAWRTPAAEAERAGDSGSCTGLVRERSGRRVAEFDLGRSLVWRLTGSVAALLVKNGVREIERGELLARLPAIPGAGAPRIAGGDWCLAEPALDREREPGARFVLGLLALDDLEHVELPFERDPAGPAGELRARGAQRFVASKARSDAPVVWELEYRVGEQALYRSRGSVP